MSVRPVLFCIFYTNSFYIVLYMNLLYIVLYMNLLNMGPRPSFIHAIHREPEGVAKVSNFTHTIKYLPKHAHCSILHIYLLKYWQNDKRCL